MRISDWSSDVCSSDLLDIVWRREMISHSYRPTWVTAQTSDGPVRAIGFAINRSHERYTGALPEETVAETIAHAAGFLGPCSSEERRVGQECVSTCRSRGAQDNTTKKQKDTISKPQA